MDISVNGVSGILWKEIKELEFFLDFEIKSHDIYNDYLLSVFGTEPDFLIPRVLSSDTGNIIKSVNDNLIDFNYEECLKKMGLLYLIQPSKYAFKNSVYIFILPSFDILFSDNIKGLNELRRKLKLFFSKKTQQVFLTTFQQKYLNTLLIYNILCFISEITKEIIYKDGGNIFINNSAKMAEDLKSPSPIELKKALKNYSDKFLDYMKLKTEDEANKVENGYLMNYCKITLDNDLILTEPSDINIRPAIIYDRETKEVSYNNKNKKLSLTKFTCRLQRNFRILLYDHYVDNEIVIGSVENAITSLVKKEAERTGQKTIYIDRLKEKIPNLNLSKKWVIEDPVMEKWARNILSSKRYPDKHVLIYGETGTGKEMTAEILHKIAFEGKKDFSPLNCSQLSEELADSRLFGHKKGAFTGAIENHIGLIEQLEGGTLFLDEIHYLPPATLGKLLRYLDSGEVLRIGSNEILNSKTRIVAGTNSKGFLHDKELASRGFFARFHFFISIPPLRLRKKDCQELTEIFIDEARNKYFGKKKLTTEGEKRLNLIINSFKVKMMNEKWQKANIRGLETTILTTMDFELDKFVYGNPHYIRKNSPGRKRKISPQKLFELVLGIDNAEYLHKQICSKLGTKYHSKDSLRQLIHGHKKEFPDEFTKAIAKINKGGSLYNYPGIKR